MANASQNSLYVMGIKTVTMIVTNKAVAHVGDFMLLRLTSIAMWLKGVAELIVDS